jgi:hypothetical protein
MILHTGHIKSFREPGLTNALMVELHPRLLVDKIVACRGAELIFTYSRYEVAQPGLQAAAPRSAVLHVPASDVTPNWLVDRLAELGPTEEMAWHSWVECRSGGFHIPMIDFIGVPARSALRQLDRMLAAEVGLNGHFMFFETGRSLHAYLPDLIPEHAWPKYLGQLLLLNEDNRPPLIDTRWVGHALVRGFAALRWSHNTNRYLAMPRVASILNPGGL